MEVTIFAYIAFGFLAFLALAQLGMSIAFTRIFNRSRPPVDDARLPKTAVLLSLRGADPFLSRCINGILDQDYPDFHVHIIVDRQDDPAWKVAHQIVADHGATNVDGQQQHGASHYEPG
mgnify:CR=1 FL=1